MDILKFKGIILFIVAFLGAIIYLGLMSVLAKDKIREATSLVMGVIKK